MYNYCTYVRQGIMSEVLHVVKEEYNRLLELKLKYDSEIENLPKGCLIQKSRHNQVYSYLVFREGKKVISKYLGKSGSDKVIELSEKTKSHKNFENLRKEVSLKLKT